ncbi:MAG: cysteine desulfurase [Oligoflexia bacterium]|nr:cysteine desulfurase [Oligoflexia bacterium]
MSDIQKYFPQIQYLKKQKQAYLDNAATTLKPQCVLDTLTRFYKEQVSNVHRGDHYLSDELTLSYENTRAQIQKWIKAERADEIIFTKSTTEGINFLSFALENTFQEGDEILLTEMEHHSNILPWQALAKRKKLKLKFLPVDERGELILSQWELLVSKKTKLFSFTCYSNALGTRNPVEKLITWAKDKNILTVVDAAQTMTVEPVNVQKMGCDFLAFSGHKLFAPTGVGILYVKKAHYEKLRPWQLGGGMVTDVDLSSYEQADPPQCFEAGTPPIEGVLAFGSVLDFLSEQNFFKNIADNKSSLLHYAGEELKKIPGVEVIGSSPTRVNILSFILKSVHCRDLGQLISQAGVAVRSGHHCCLPLMKRLNLPSGTVRASFSVYNDEQDVELLISAVKKAKSILL